MSEQDKYTEYMMLSIDGEIRPQQAQELEAYLAQHPHARLEFEQLKACVVEEEQVNFAFKDDLYKIANQPRRLSFLRSFAYASAAVVLLLLGVRFFMRQSTNNQDYQAQQVATTQTSETPVREDQIQKEVLQPVPNIGKSQKVTFAERKTLPAVNARRIDNADTAHQVMIANTATQNQVEQEMTADKQAIEQNKLAVKSEIVADKVQLPIVENITVKQAVAAKLGSSSFAPELKAPTYTTIELGPLDIELNNNDSGRLSKVLRKGVQLFKAGKEIAQNGINININY